MKCPKCGGEYDRSDRFCRSCGADLSAEKARLDDDAPTQAEKSETTKHIAPELVDKGKFHKYFLKATFAVFIVLSFFVYLIPVGFRANVYQTVGAGDYTNGLDGRWETEYFLIGLFVNIFSDIDLVRTPCAIMVVLSFISASFIIAWIIVSAIKRKNDGHLKARPKIDLVFTAVYALFVIASGIAVYGLQNVYRLPETGSAMIVLLLLSLLCFVVSTAGYIMRKRFFDKHAELIDALHIV